MGTPHHHDTHEIKDGRVSYVYVCASACRCTQVHIRTNSKAKWDLTSIGDSERKPGQGRHVTPRVTSKDLGEN